MFESLSDHATVIFFQQLVLSDDSNADDCLAKISPKNCSYFYPQLSKDLSELPFQHRVYHQTSIFRK
jgi:hypothetical protein